ncbi:hypothetical protein BGZ83_008750 [Gryganskiella cystojenkinii]|nr:hypothetical protein BGZ83_008750 [Gryganskiella cystojenkinii]
MIEMDTLPFPFSLGKDQTSSAPALKLIPAFESNESTMLEQQQSRLFDPAGIQKFNGQVDNDPEAYLRQLKDAQVFFRLSDEDVLQVILLTLTKGALAWHRRIMVEAASDDSDDVKSKKLSFLTQFHDRFMGTEYRAFLHQQLEDIKQGQKESTRDFGDRFLDLVIKSKRANGKDDDDDDDELYRYMEIYTTGVRDDQLRRAMELSLAPTLEDLVRHGNHIDRRLTHRLALATRRAAKEQAVKDAEKEKVSGKTKLSA